MLSLPIDGVVATLNGWPPEALWALMIALCFGTTVLAARLFGALGLTVYVAVAVIGANIQVLKPVQFGVFADPVALGTVLFASTYLATDMLTELYGRPAARRAVLLGFGAMVLWTLIAVMTLGFRPLTPAEAGDGLAWALPVHDSMATLFTPVPALLIAGMTAYLISQYHDIWLYGLLRRLTGGRHLWLRNNASTALSGLIDNTVFSVLAWVVLAAEPIAWGTLVSTYIIGTWVLRLVVAALDTPFLYLARRTVRPLPDAAYA